MSELQRLAGDASSIRRTLRSGVAQTRTAFFDKTRPQFDDRIAGGVDAEIRKFEILIDDLRRQLEHASQVMG